MCFKFESEPASIVEVFRFINDFGDLTNVRQTFIRDWAYKSDKIMHADAPPILNDDEEGKRDRLRKRPQCFRLGLCMCGEPGQKLFKVRNDFSG